MKLEILAGVTISLCELKLRESTPNPHLLSMRTTAMASSELDSLQRIDQELAEMILKRDRTVEQLSRQDALPDIAAESSWLGQTARAALQSDLDLDQTVVQTTQDSLAETLQHIASHSRNRFQPESVSFLGPQYSYSHLAAIKYFGDAIQFCAVANIPAVFDAVHRGDSTAGLVPIENSTDGRIVDTLGMFVRRHMQICGEVLLPIHHNLLASGTREQITEIQSKPQALSQCRGWIAANFPAAKLVEVGSTTAAAKAASKHRHIAAVASLPAGRAYGLTALNQNIEDNADNVTRFAVLGKKQPTCTGNDKTSVLFQVEHKPGALAEVMAIFSDASLNLTWIESFPAPGTRNEYLFFVEFAGHRTEKAVDVAMDNLNQITHRLELLGSYPLATLE